MSMLRRIPRLVVAAGLSLGLVLGMSLGLGLAATPAGAADPVRGPNGPEINCLNLFVPHSERLRCRLTGFVANRPVEVTIAGDGVVATLRPDRSGAAALSIEWPYDRHARHRVRVVQEVGNDVRSSSIVITTGSNLKPSTDEGDDEADDDEAEDDDEAADIDELPERGESQVPLRVSAAVGLGSAALVVLGVRGRRRRRFGS